MDAQCPHCDSYQTSAHFVDIGVGFQQATPFVCHDCGAREFSPYDEDNAKATLPEKLVGWWLGMDLGEAQT